MDIHRFMAVLFIFFILLQPAQLSAVTVEVESTWTDWTQLKQWEYTPPLVDYNLRMGVKGYLTKDYYTGIVFLKEFIRKHPRSPYADYVTYYLSMSYKMVELEEQAIFHFKKLLHNYPDSPFTYYAFVEIEKLYFRMAEYSAVIEHYQRFRSTYPISIYSGRWVTEFIPNEITYLVGQSYYMLNKLEEADEVLQRLSETTNDFLFGQYTLGLIDYRKGQIDSALEHLDGVVHSEIVTTPYFDPIVDKASLTMGRILYEREDYDRAVDTLLQILPQSAFYFEALDTIAWSLIQSENKPLAISYLSDIIALHPTSAVQSACYELIGLIYTDLNDAGGGIVFYKEAKKVLSTEIEALRQIIGNEESLQTSIEDLQEIHRQRRSAAEERPARGYRMRRRAYYPKSLGFEIFYEKYLNSPRLQNILTLSVETEKITNGMRIGGQLGDELEEIFSRGPFDKDDETSEDLILAMMGEEALWALTDLQQIYAFSSLKLFDIENRYYDIFIREDLASPEETRDLRHNSIEASTGELRFLLLPDLSIEAIAEPFTKALTKVRNEPVSLETREKRFVNIMGRRSLLVDLDVRCDELAAMMDRIANNIPYRSRDLLLSEMILYSRNLYMLREISQEHPLEPPEPVRLTVDMAALNRRYEEIKAFPPLYQSHFDETHRFLMDRIRNEVQLRITEKIEELQRIDLEIDFYLSRALLLKAREDLHAVQSQ